MTDVVARPQRLERLTAARAFAALAVFLFHAGTIFSFSLLPITTLGYAGVSFFFILSGFVLTWSAPDKISAGRFYRRRFARIYPAYALLLVVAAVIGSAGAPSATEKSSLLAVLLLQAWVAGPGIYALNPPSWSLSVEAAFYAAMPALHHRVRALSPRWRWSIVLVWFAAFSSFAAAGSQAGGSLATAALASPIGRGAEFLLGMAAAIELRNGRRLGLVPATAIAAASIGACLVFGGTSPLPTAELDPLFLVVIVLLAQRDLAGASGWVLPRRLPVYLGTVSYEFYLVHEMVLVRVGRLGLSRPTGVVLSLAIALAAAVMLYELVQRPLEALLRTPRRALTIGAALVVGAGAAVVLVLPAPQLPVRNAEVSLSGAIRAAGRTTVQIRGTESVDFSGASPSASGSFTMADGTRTVTVEERAIGGTFYNRSTQGSSTFTDWVAEPLDDHGTGGVGLPGRPDDDPAHFIDHLRTLGNVRVVGHPFIGATKVTKVRIQVPTAEISSQGAIELGFGQTRLATLDRLTIWALVDPDHLVRSVQYRGEFTERPGERLTVTARYTFGNFNGAAPLRARPSTSPTASANPDGRAYFLLWT